MILSAETPGPIFCGAEEAIRTRRGRDCVERVTDTDSSESVSNVRYEQYCETCLTDCALKCRSPSRVPVTVTL